MASIATVNGRAADPLIMLFFVCRATMPPKPNPSDNVIDDYGAHVTQLNLEPGTIFARDFQVVRPLRAGGMGAVYVVNQISTGKQRALKLMMPELVGNPEVRERFVREARAAANMESEHVVETVIAGIDEQTGAPYLVMELLRGEELSDAVERTGALPFADIAEIYQQIGHALSQAHEAGLVHRDLKPENIFLSVAKRADTAFTAKILDFGIAKLVEEGVEKTGTQPLGSPLYMAPEQTDRKGRICPATDVWALGLVAFHLLTGKSFWREAEEGSLQTLLREIIIDPLATASLRAAELGLPHALPPGFDAWFSRCVNRDIDQRYPEAGAAVAAFVQLGAGQAAERKLKIATSAIERMDPATTKRLEMAQTAAHVASGAKTSHGSTTGIASMAVGSQPPAHLAAPSAPKRGALIAVAGAAIMAAVGGWFVFGRKTVDPAAAASSAPTASPASVLTAVSSAVATLPGGCPEGMALLQGGATILGAKDMPDWSEAKTTHPVTLSPFCIDKTEVTVAAYEECVGKARCEKTPDDVDYDKVSAEARAAYKDFCNARKPDRKDHPINCVDWDMAQAYCSFRGGRLPTEAQWEFAARGPEQRDYPWGSEAPDPSRLNAAGPEFADWSGSMKMSNAKMYPVSDTFVGSAPVGSFPAGATPNGVLDLAGNVFEWTADWFAPYSADDAKDPKGPDAGTMRVARGGAFNATDPTWVRTAYRWANLPRTYNHGIGFRCVMDPSP